jgi:hypothetical protein
VAERKMSLYMILSRRPIHRGRHVHGLHDADDGSDRRMGQAYGTPDLRYSATPAPIIAWTSVLAAAACR